jgi:hypothetical protein
MFLYKNWVINYQNLNKVIYKSKRAKFIISILVI